MGLFGTAGIRGDATTDVPPELALAVGRAAGIYATGRGFDAAVVGRDGRVTGPGLTAATEAGLLSAGMEVRRAGQLPTPALAFASRGCLGVMVTASHNPPTDNGLKLFADGREFDALGETRVEDLVDSGVTPADWDAWGSAEPVAVLDAYRSAVVDFATRWGGPLDGLRVAVDCGNGTGAHATPQVLSDLGADVTALNATVDGHFPARPSKPTPGTLGQLRSFVAEGEYDIGFAHDGDADRVVVTDGEGAIVHEDTVLAVLAEHAVRASDADAPTVVTTPNASARIDERVSAAGGRTTRVALGELHVGVTAATERGEVVAFAAEPWKHLHPGLGGWIDGVASAAVLARLVAGAGGLGPLVDPVVERPYRKGEVECPDRLKEAVVADVAERLPRQFPEANVNTEYGVRLDGPDGWWVLVRPSGTEPVVRIYAEGDDADALMAEVTTVVEAAVPDR